MPLFLIPILSAMGISQKFVKWIALGIVLFAILTVVGGAYFFVSGLAQRAEKYAAQLAVSRIKTELAVEAEKMVRGKVEKMVNELKANDVRIRIEAAPIDDFTPSFKDIPLAPGAPTEKTEKRHALRPADLPSGDFNRLNRLLERAAN